ncbi:AAA family ATPase [Sodalis ligni]|uniref:AAA family ATPase n=1 Tax=Sodalis ligni TaxID=2697027 RepID=UPI0030B81512
MGMTIEKLGNADWVHKGLTYIIKDECPFCQQEFDAEHFKEEFRRLFDENFTESLNAIKLLAEKHKEWHDYLQMLKSELNACSMVSQDDPIYSLLSSIEKAYLLNDKLLADKITTPSAAIVLPDIRKDIKNMCENVTKINLSINKNNDMADNYDEELANLKNDLLGHLRKMCDDFLKNRDNNLGELKSNEKIYQEKINTLENLKNSLLNENSKNMAAVTNIEKTVNDINLMLVSLGVTGFKIVRHSQEQEVYRLSRDDWQGEKSVFKSLSEGEKTLISFLYFIEKCYGRDNREDNDDRENL